MVDPHPQRCSWLEAFTYINKIICSCSPGECIFTLESDPNTRIEMIVQEVNLFGNGVTTPPSPCLNLYNVQADGTIVLLKT